MTTVTAANDATPGYIVSRTTEQFGRPVAFVFAGNPPEADGATLFLTAQRLEQSVNFKSLTEGLAYPTYYQGLFSDLRAKLTSAAASARAQNLNIWAEDVTNSGFDVPDLLAIRGCPIGC